MTEQEFNKRLLEVIQKSGNSVNGMAGIADIFSGIKNVVTNVGSSLINGLKTAGSTIFSGVKAIGSGVTSIFKSDVGKELLTAGATVYTAKLASDVQTKQIEAAQVQQQNALSSALIAQGINPASTEAQNLIAQVARTGIVGSNGQVLFPAANSYVNGVPVASASSAGGFDMKSLTPILLAAAGLMALAIVIPSRTPEGRAASRRR